MPKGLQGFQPNNPGRPRGSKNKLTLLKEERRAIFDTKISKKWEKVIDILKPEYIADQFMGKAPEVIKLQGAIQVDSDIAKKNALTSSTENNSKRST